MHQAGGDGVGFEGHGHQLGLEADLHHQVGCHEVARIAVPAADQVQPGGHGPQHPSTVTVEVVGCWVGVAHPKMLPGLLSVVVVVEGTWPSTEAMRLSTSL